MSKDKDWIDARFEDARKAYPTVTDDAATRLKELLKGQLSEQQLRPKELAETARVLIADMAAPAAPKTEIDYEN